MKDSELGLAAMHRICRKAGAKRVSESATIEMAKVLEKIGYKIAKAAIENMWRLRD